MSNAGANQREQQTPTVTFVQAVAGGRTGTGARVTQVGASTGGQSTRSAPSRAGVIHGQGGIAAGNTAGTSASQARAGTSRAAQQANAAGSAGALPETGSDGYTGLLAGGGAMLLAGSGLLIYRRRFGAAG